jgi:CHAT domain-containing protein
VKDGFDLLRFSITAKSQSITEVYQDAYTLYLQNKGPQASRRVDFILSSPAYKELTDAQKVKVLTLQESCYAISGKAADAESAVDAAIALLEESQTITDKDPDRFLLYREKSTLRGLNGDIDGAIRLRELAIKAAEESTDKNPVSIKQQAYAEDLGVLASYLLSKGNLERAIMLGTESLKKLDTLGGPPSPILIGILADLASANMQLYRISSAREYVRRAKELLSVVSNVPITVEVATNEHLAAVYEAEGLHNEAIRIFDEIIERSKTTYIPQRNVISAYIGAGNAYAALGSYGEAIASIGKAESLIAVKDIESQRFLYITRVAGLLVLFRVGRFEEVLASTIEIERFFTSHFPDDQILPRVFILSGAAAHKLGRYQKADEDLNTSLTLMKSKHPTDSMLAYTPLTIAYNLTIMGDLKRADAILQEERQKVAYPSTHEKRDEVTIQRILIEKLAAEWHIKNHDGHAAVEDSLSALSIESRYNGNNLGLISDILDILSRGLSESNISTSIAIGKLVANYNQNTKRYLSELDDKKSLSFFSKSVRLAEAQHVLDAQKVIEYSDYSGANSQNSQIADIPYTGAEKHFTDALVLALSKMNNLQNAIDSSRRNGNDTKLTASIFNAIKENEKELYAIIRQGVREPEQEAPTKDPRLKRIQLGLSSSKDNSFVLRYVILDSYLSIIAIGPTSIASYKQEITAHEIQSIVSTFATELSNPKKDPTRSAQKLYSLLFKPVKDALTEASARHILLSLDGPLRRIPFAALHDGNHYLVNDYEFSVLPHVVDLPQEEGTTPANLYVHAFGTTKSFDHLPALPDVRHEIMGIVENGNQGFMPGEINLDADFTYDKLSRTLINHPSILHIASHYIPSPGSERNSFLLLGDGKKLSLSEIDEITKDLSSTELLTLSACNSAMAVDVSTDGKDIDGLGTTFMKKGVKTVVASLWPVADLSTSLLMKLFYKNIPSHPRRSEALRQAQLSLINKHLTAPADTSWLSSLFSGAHTYSYAHPFYWAPFIAMGKD